jgi:hypothetical protein
MGTGSDASVSLLAQWIFGGAVVVLYARDRFNSPRLIRAMTTFWRYWLAWFGYIVAMLALFVLLGGGMTTVDPGNFLRLFGVTDANVDGTLPGPLLSAMLLTSLLPHFPAIGKIDNAVKEWFQRVGNIPYEVRELGARLRSASYEPSADRLDELIAIIGSAGFDRAWLREPQETMKRRWARCVLLYAQIVQWQDSRSFSRYVDDSKTPLSEIRNRVNMLRDVLDSRALTELDGAGDSSIVAHMRRKIGTELGELNRALHDFVSGGVLNSARSEGQRHAALAKLGFSGLPEPRNSLNAHDIVLVTGLVFLAMLFIPLMMRRFIDPSPLDQQLRVLVMVPIIYAIAIVVAIYPKSVWLSARRQRGGPRPIAAYALSGAVAAFASFIVAVLFRFAFDAAGNVFQAIASPGAFERAWNISVARWPWLLMTFFVTVAIAWAADDQVRSPGAEPIRLRLAECGTLAVVFGVLIWTVIQLLAMGMPPEGAARFLGATPRMLTTAVIIGACIGWFVPHLYRSRSRSDGFAAPVLQEST